MNQKNEDAQLLKLRMENARLQKENAELNASSNQKSSWATISGQS